MSFTKFFEMEYTMKQTKLEKYMSKAYYQLYLELASRAEDEADKYMKLVLEYLTQTIIVDELEALGGLDLMKEEE